jgi:hypothetical protein
MLLLLGLAAIRNGLEIAPTISEPVLVPESAHCPFGD